MQDRRSFLRNSLGIGATSTALVIAGCSSGDSSGGNSSSGDSSGGNSSSGDSSGGNQQTATSGNQRASANQSSGGNYTEGKSYSFTFGSLFPDQHIVTNVGQDWADSVKKETNERIKISIKPSFGAENDITQQVSIGAIDGGLLGIQWVQHYAPKLFWLETPFVFKSWDQKLRAFESSDYGNQLKEAVEKKGNQRILGSGIFQGQRLLTANRKISTPSELNNIKMRVSNLDSWQSVWNGLGANATSISFDELYSALQQGVANAQENPATSIKSKSMYEVQSAVMLTNHLPQDGWVSFNLNTWQNLSDSDKKFLSSSLRKTIKKSNKTAGKRQKQILSFLENNGMDIVDVDRSKWFKKAEPSLKELWSKKNWTGTLQEARNI